MPRHQFRLCPQKLHDDLAIRLDAQRVPHEGESHLRVEKFGDSQGRGSTDPRRWVSTGGILKSTPPSKVKGAAKDTVPPPSPRSFNGFSEITSFIWSVADLLRGDYNQADYGKIILPLTVLRRLDCVLEKPKAKVLAKHAELRQAKHPEGAIDKLLRGGPERVVMGEVIE
jgi:HsdM N-terminal domain